ncbi:MAG TPA: PspC domain-containing protein [Candidatus Limnocylindria bacterium]|jgi:phage shock protein PspC (stress-responsive transcriptional regulator)
MNRRLYRSRTESVLGGVAGGVAEYLDADPSIVRIIWAILGIVTGGIFVVLYIVMWIVVPEAPVSAAPASAATATAAPPAASGEAAGQAASPSVMTQASPPRRRSSGGRSLVFGLILVGLGAWFLIREYVPQIDTDLLWPIGLVALGVVLVIASLRRQSGE